MGHRQNISGGKWEVRTDVTLTAGFLYRAGAETTLNFREQIDERQIAHLICARLKYDLYDFFRGVLGPFIQEKEQEAGPKHP